MKICILGVARSGTTAIYSLVQDILSQELSNDIDYIYEPFLWNKNVFNGKYNDVKEKLRYVESLSYEGIYFHKKLPLFITDTDKFRGNKYLKRILSAGKQDKNMVAKFTRANGRFPLLSTICPECKFIFIIRNPMDVVHSILSRFSFFGREFHQDDYDRFLNEVNAIYGTKYTKKQFTEQAEREVLYWYYSNRFFLEKIKTMDVKPLVICHEDYVARRQHVLGEILEYLGIAFDPKYVDKAGEKIGPVSENYSLRDSDYKILLAYLDKYKELLDGLNLDITLDMSAVTGKYAIHETPVEDQGKYNWLTPIHLKRLYISELRKNTLLKDKLAQQQSVIADQTKTIEELNRLLIKKKTNKNLSRKTNQTPGQQINTKNEMIKERDNAIADLSQKIMENAGIIGRLEAELVAGENIIEKNEKEKSNLKKKIAEMDLQLQQLRERNIPPAKRIAVYDPGFRKFGHNIYFNMHILDMFSRIFDEVYYFEGGRTLKEKYENLPPNVKIQQIPFKVDINNDSFYGKLWDFIDQYMCDLLFLSSEGARHDKALYTTPPRTPYTILIHIVWQMQQRIKEYGQIDEVLKNAAGLFVMEDCLMKPLIGKNGHLSRIPYFVFDDDFEAGVKEDVPGSNLKIATVGFINDRRNIDFILDTLMLYKGEPIEYYLYGKPLGETGEKIEKMAKEYSFPSSVKMITKFDYLTDEEYVQTARDCDFILIAYDEKRKLQTPGAIYQFSNQNTILIVPEIDPFVSIGQVYKDLFVFYDGLSSASLINLLNALAKKGKEYREIKIRSAAARKKFVEVNRKGNQLKLIKQAFIHLLKNEERKNI